MPTPPSRGLTTIRTRCSGRVRSDPTSSSWDACTGHAALAALRARSTEPEIQAVRTWLDSWSGLGAIVVGMRRHGYELTLTHDKNGWGATFLYRTHLLRPWVGQVLWWWPTPWRAVQEAAWRALNTPFAEDYSLSEEWPR